MSTSRVARAFSPESEVEGEAPFEQPAIGRGGVQAGEEPVECDPLAVACEVCAVSCGSGVESLLERPAEGGGVAVSHAAASRSSRSMKV